MSHPLEGVMQSRAFAVFDALAALTARRGFHLIGGTALALQLHHRTSSDLDFFGYVDFTPGDVLHEIAACGLRHAVTGQSVNTLNLVCEDVPVQFLADPAQRRIVEPARIGPVLVAGVPDICAMKLNAVLGRAKLRDYFDLMIIDTVAPIPLEHGLQLFLERYQPAVPQQTVTQIVLALGYLDDVEDDPTLPIERDVLVRFWNRRQPQIVEHLSRSGPATR